MNQETYINERLEDQINWYDSKGQWNQRWFKNLQLSDFIAAASIPFVSSLADYLPGYPIIVGALGVYIAVATGAMSLYKFQENWIQYRTTTEQLRHEKYMFLAGIPPYDGKDAFFLLVDRVESLISKENSSWAKQTRITNRQDQSPDNT